MDPVTTPEIIQQVTELAAQDFSLMALFWRADIVVKLVMLGLIGSSIWTWAIIFEKTMTMRRLTAQADAFEKLFWSGESVQKLYLRFGGESKNPPIHSSSSHSSSSHSSSSHPMSRVFMTGMREWLQNKARDKQKTSSAPATAPSEARASAGLMQRIDRLLTVSIAREMAALEKRMLFLATVGSVAPFVGLFGTVWGIMNSFQAIALSRDTNLAVVAPGIAEALFATGLGLLAAIPAVIAYNKFTMDTGIYAGRLDMFADEFSSLFSRQLEERS